MKFFKSIIFRVVEFLLLVTAGLLKFLLKVQLKVKNIQPDYYVNLKSSLENEFSDSEAMDSLADEYAELESKSNTDTGKDYFSKIRYYLQKELDRNINLKKTPILESYDHYYISDDIENLSLKSSLEDSFNSGSKYSDLMHQINIVEKKALNKERKLLESRLIDLYSTISAKSKDVFDKEKQEVYKAHNLHAAEISKAAKIVKMSIVNNFNEELDKVESSIDDIDCETCVRSTTSEPVVTKGSFYRI